MSTVMGFDYGEKRIGIAVGNTITRTATALTSVNANNRNEQLAQVATLINEWAPQTLVLGLPSYTDHSEATNGVTNEAANEAAKIRTNEHPVAKRVKTFAQSLQHQFKQPIAFVDERFTSTQAEGALKASGIKKMQQISKTGKLDAMAAQIILQQYLDSLPA
jgi:putative holliday junction resolvase